MQNAHVNQSAHVNAKHANAHENTDVDTNAQVHDNAHENAKHAKHANVMLNRHVIENAMHMHMRMTMQTHMYMQNVKTLMCMLT